MRRRAEEDEHAIVEDFLKRATDGMHDFPPEFEAAFGAEVESLFATDEEAEEEED